MKNIIFPISALALIILAFTNRKTIIQPDETPKIDLTLEPVGTTNIDETPILEKYIQNSLKDPESKLPSAIIGGVAGIAGALGTAYSAYYLEKKISNTINDILINNNNI